MKKGFVYLVGAGPGDPELITLKALDALAQAECIIYDYLANSHLVEEYDCEKIYVGKSGSNHTLSQKEITKLIVRKARDGKIVTRLKGGDPFIFGRGGEEAESLAEAGIPFCIVPGISSFYSSPAYAGIPLTHRDYANALEVVTGHRRADGDKDEDVNFPEYDPHRTYTFLMGVKNLPHISASLINKKNFPEETPVALVSWGTTPRQRVVTGPLKDISDIAGKGDIKPPSIIVVGKVVALREKLRWFDNQPLFGKKIVVTRTRSQSSDLSKQLSILGVNVIEFPTIEIKPMDDPGPLETAIRRLKQFSWIFFTSQNAVNILFDKLFNMGFDARALGGIKIAVIGPATGDELMKYGIKPDMMPKEYVAESLLKQAERLDINGRKILLPCGEEARLTLADGLRKLGADIERIHTYRSVKPDNISQDKIDEVKNADVITFTSSSTAKNFFSLIPSVNADLASIGPVTSKTIRGFGKEPDIVAEEHTIYGLIKTMIDHYK
jgi:uroporphyrinogen III methyltransferase/synthase